MTNIIQDAETEIVNFVQGAEAMLSADAKILWTAFSTIWATLAPSEWATFQPIVTEAITDIFDGDLADLETAVLLKAEAVGVDFLKKLDSAALQAVLALFVKSAPSASA